MYFSPGVPRLTFNRIVFLLVAKQNIFPLLLYSSLILRRQKRRNHVRGKSFLNFHFLTLPVLGLLLSKGQFNRRREATFIPQWPSSFCLSLFPLCLLCYYTVTLCSLCTLHTEKGREEKKGKVRGSGSAA